MKLPRVVCLRMFSAGILLLIVTSCLLPAAERTWDGTGRSSDWTDQANWLNGIVPVPGDSLRFPFGAGHLTNTNDYTAGTDFNALTLAATGYTLHGNSIDLGAGLAVTHSTGSSICYLPITLLANQTFSVTQPGATLFLNGVINMSARTLTFDVAGQVIVSANIINNNIFLNQLRKQGSGLLWLFQPADYDAATLINGGTVRVDGRVTNSFFIVNSTGSLRGAGRVGGFRANSGGTVQPGFSAPDTLDVFGDVELRAGSIYAVRLNSTADYDQLNVRGTVTLGGTLNVTAAFAPAVGDTFIIIENDDDDDVIGTFAGLPEGAQFTINGRPFRISYGNRFGGPFGRENDVIIEAVPALAIWDGGGTNDNRWSQPLNWVGDALPWDGDDLQFASPTNGGPLLVTRNDFPASRYFSSIFFGQGNHQLQGDTVDVRGRLETTDRAFVDIRAPLILRGGVRHDPSPTGNLTLRAPVTLSAGQTFFIVHSNASFSMPTNLNLSGHQLTVNSLGTPSFRDINGPGTLVKTGPSGMRLLGTSLAGTTMVEAGTFVLEGNSLGTILVNTGSVFVAEGNFLDVEVRNGGILKPGYLTEAFGDIRLLPGSIFHVVFDETFLDSGMVETNTGITCSNLVEVADAELLLELAHPIGSHALRIIRPARFSSVQMSGNFHNLPDGAFFAAGGRALAVSYNNGVTLTPDPELVWDGGGNGGNWAIAQNWSPDFVPAEQMDLRFPAVTKRTATNDLPSGMLFGNLIFTADSYALYGNRFKLNGALSANILSNEVTVYADIDALQSGNNGFGIGVGGSATLNLEGAIFCSGDLSKNGLGTVRFAGTKPNSQEMLWVHHGDVQLAKVGANAISKLLRIGFPDPTVVTYFGNDQISDFAGVIVDGDDGGSRLDLNGYSDAIGGLNGSGIVDFSGRFPVRPGELSVASGLFGGNFVGSGTFVKVPPPPGYLPQLLTLSGVNTFSGNTFVNGGELRVEGTFVNSPIRLNGGTLSGRGHVSTITANLGGTLSPGSGGTALNVALHSGNVALNAATTFRTLLTSPTTGLESHKLNVTGTVNLGGCALTIDLYQNFMPPQGLRFVIIENDGADPVVGTFSGLPPGAWTLGEGFAFTVSYVGGDGNDVELTRTNLPPSTLSPIVLVTPEQITIRGQGVSGGRYDLQRSTDLNSPLNWMFSGSAIASNGVFELFDYQSPFDPNPPKVFYRVVSP
jgi:autotransporter-associated beta strand protein